jgi:hypothetical protein
MGDVECRLYWAAVRIESSPKQLLVESLHHKGGSMWEDYMEKEYRKTMLEGSKGGLCGKGIREYYM